MSNYIDFAMMVHGALRKRAELNAQQNVNDPITLTIEHSELQSLLSTNEQIGGTVGNALATELRKQGLTAKWSMEYVRMSVVYHPKPVTTEFTSFYNLHQSL